MYEYRARLLDDDDIHDGDTVRLEVDLGFNVHLSNIPFRLNRINAPELSSSDPRGRISRDQLRLWCPDNEELIIITQKDKTEKYGRYLSDLYVDGVCLNDRLVEEGFALYWDGHGARPV